MTHRPQPTSQPQISSPSHSLSHRHGLSRSHGFSRSHIKALAITAGLLMVASAGLGCGDGMLGFSSGGAQSEQVQQAHEVVDGRYKAPASVAEAGRQQAGNISYDDADQCIGTGNPILDGTGRLARFLRDSFDGPSRYDSTVYCRSVRGGASLSMHATGRAIDLYIPTIGEQADNSAGDPVANYLIQNATALGVQYFIWDKTQFNTSRGYTEDYCRRNCWEHGGGKHPHHDHLHIELTKHAANHLQLADIPPVGPSDGSQAVAPDVPDTWSPIDGDSVWTDSVTLSAEQVSDAYRYVFDIQRYDGTQWKAYYTYETDRSFKKFWPTGEAVYRWRVQVSTNGGTSEYSPWSTFGFGTSSDTEDSSSGSAGSGSSSTPQTDAPTGASPTDSERVFDSSVRLTVDAVSDAFDYEFEIQVHDGSQWIDYWTYELDSSFKDFWPYYLDAAYRWRARARTSSGWTDDTEWNVFLYGKASSP